jgi:hypothetical protein
MREVTAPGRWVWVLAGLVTAAVLAISGTRLIDSAWLGWPAQPPGISVSAHPAPTGPGGSAHPTPASAP